jgi:hypothetical protein
MQKQEALRIKNESQKEKQQQQHTNVSFKNNDTTLSETGPVSETIKNYTGS